MKKIILCLVFAVVAHFSFADTLINPMFGYGLFTSTIKDKSIDLIVKNKYSAFDTGLSLGTVIENGFTFLFDYQVMLKNKFIYKESRAGVAKPDTIYNKVFMWDIDFIFGYTFRVLDDSLHIRVGAGPAIGAGMRGWDHDKFFFYAGGAFRFGLDYYFLDWLGVGLSITDSVGYGATNHPDTNAFWGGIGNLFQIKFGPSFKLK